MPVAKLRKVGGSVMVTLPPSVLQEARMAEGASVDVSVDAASGTIALKSTAPRYTLAELLAEVDPSLEDAEETARWLSDGPVGSEII